MIKLHKFTLQVVIFITAIAILPVNLFAAIQQKLGQDSFEGTYKGTAGDDQLDERWSISKDDSGNWYVVGYYYWNKKGVANDPAHRKIGKLAGSFESSNIRLDNGMLKFTQTFDNKPIPTWADTTNMEVQLKGNTLIFSNQYVTGIKLTRT